MIYSNTNGQRMFYIITALVFTSFSNYVKCKLRKLTEGVLNIDWGGNPRYISCLSKGI